MGWANGAILIASVIPLLLVMAAFLGALPGPSPVRGCAPGLLLTHSLCCAGGSQDLQENAALDKGAKGSPPALFSTSNEMQMHSPFGTRRFLLLCLPTAHAERVWAIQLQAAALPHSLQQLCVCILKAFTRKSFPRGDGGRARAGAASTSGQQQGPDPEGESGGGGRPLLLGCCCRRGRRTSLARHPLLAASVLKGAAGPEQIAGEFKTIISISCLGPNELLNIPACELPFVCGWQLSLRFGTA